MYVLPSEPICVLPLLGTPCQKSNLNEVCMHNASWHGQRTCSNMCMSIHAARFMGGFKFRRGKDTSVRSPTSENRHVCAFVLSFTVVENMGELHSIVAFLLFLIQKSVEQPTSISPKKYRQIGVTVDSWNSMQVRATGFFGMGSIR